MLPAVIFHMPERDDSLAVDVVECVQPGVVVVIRDVTVMRRSVNYLAVVLRRLERGAQPSACDRVRRNQMDGSFVVAKGAGGCVGNVSLFARVLLGVEGCHPVSVQKIGCRGITRPF